MEYCYVIMQECDAYNPHDITATYTEFVGFVETEEEAKEYCAKRNAEYQYKIPYSYECVGRLLEEYLYE